MLIIKVAFLTTIMLCLFSRQAVLVATGLFFSWPPLPGKQNPQQAAMTAVIAESRNKCAFRTDLLITFPSSPPAQPIICVLHQLHGSLKVTRLF